MGSLQASRVNVFRPFFRCGVDYAGPLLLREEKRRNARLTASTRLASWWTSIIALSLILSAIVKHVRPHLRPVQIKFGKQRKSHFSRPSALEAIIPRETLGR